MAIVGLAEGSIGALLVGFERFVCDVSLVLAVWVFVDFFDFFDLLGGDLDSEDGLRRGCFFLSLLRDLETDLEWFLRLPEPPFFGLSNFDFLSFKGFGEVLGLALDPFVVFVASFDLLLGFSWGIGSGNFSIFGFNFDWDFERDLDLLRTEWPEDRRCRSSSFRFECCDDFFGFELFFAFLDFCSTKLVKKDKKTMISPQ